MVLRVQCLTASGRIFFLTSHPYPIEATESIESSASYTKSVVGNVQNDYITSTAFFVSAEIKLPLITYDALEAIDSTAFFVSASFPEFLSEITLPGGGGKGEYPNEALTFVGSFVGGTLQSALVSTTMAPEGLNFVGSFVSGTLT